MYSIHYLPDNERNIFEKTAVVECRFPKKLAWLHSGLKNKQNNNLKYN